MCMSLEKRLQLLLDADRYRRVAEESERSGRSVAAVIREAIDLRFPDDGLDARKAAAETLLRLSLTPDNTPGESPEQLKEAYATSLARKASAR